MYICPKCKKEMRCKKNGMICRWGAGHCYSGDKYQCPTCKFEVIACNPRPYHSEGKVNSEILVQMD